MVYWSYPPTSREIALTAAVFAIGASLFGAGAYLSFVNVAPQQARAKERSEAMRNYLRKRFGLNLSEVDCDDL
ncbi:transmembrane protein, putative [Medicago truncatula]|uniref:Transmembrane protein, putative n=1 Tax=Medicago truncatula TaxID=3880 RepID=A0A072VV48_MEDTR|nr:transmembrane protein, putative [Medicago truncatula]